MNVQCTCCIGRYTELQIILFLNKADIELRVLRPIKYNCCTSFCRCFLIWDVHIFYVKLLSTYNFCLDKITVHYINFISNFKDNIPTTPKSCKFIFYICTFVYNGLTFYGLKSPTQTVLHGQLYACLCYHVITVLSMQCLAKNQSSCDHAIITC